MRYWRLRYVIAHLLVAAASLSGCVVVNNPPPTATEQPTFSQPDPQVAPPSETESGTPKNLSESIQFCKAVQSAENLPIACEVNYYQGSPVMLIVFANFAVFNKTWGAVANKLMVPYCISAIGASRNAFLLTFVFAEKKAAGFSCETMEWSPVFDFDPSRAGSPL